MKYSYKSFSMSLLLQIKEIERTLKEQIELFSRKYKPIFSKQNLDFDIELVIEGEDPFVPGYNSSVVIGVSKKAELLDLHVIPIWKCERTFLGLPTSNNIPGSKMIGELMDESIEEVLEELEEYIEEIRKDGEMDDLL